MYIVEHWVFINKKNHISPKLIEWNMVNNYATNIKGDVWKI